MRLVVTSTVKSAPASVARCIRSVRDQSHEDWQHHVFCLDDETFDSAVSVVGKDHRTFVILVRDGAPHLANLLPLWRELPPKTPIVWLDGDDWLAVPHALAIVARAHAGGALCTYGQFITPDGMPGFSRQMNTRRPRDAPWTASHLKTFRAGLVQRIRDEDFREEDGSYAGLVTDMRVMFACLEMAPKRACFIPNILAVYNLDGSFYMNASPDEKARERREEARIRAFEPYAELPPAEQDRIAG